MRPFSPKKEKEQRNPFAPRKPNNSIDEPKTSKIAAPDRRDGGGGQVYAPHTRTTSLTDLNNDTTLLSKKRVEAIKRDLKGSEFDRELRKKFKAFAPPKRAPPVPRVEEEVAQPVGSELGESKAFDAKRVRGLGFDPRRKVNEAERRAGSERKVVPIVGVGAGGNAARISLDGVLGRERKGGNRMNEVVESDSDDDLDIVMKDMDIPNPFMREYVKV